MRQKKYYFVRANARGWQITVAYLVSERTAAGAFHKLRRYLEDNNLPFEARARPRIATDRDIHLFKQYEKAIID